MACMKKSCVEARRLAAEAASLRTTEKSKQKGECEYITEELLTGYIDTYLQIREGNLLTQLGFDSGYINQQVSLLADALIATRDLPGTCVSKNYIPVWKKDREFFLQSLT